MGKKPGSFPTHADGEIPGAYIIEHVATGMCYVGSTSHLANRRTRHLSMLRTGTHHNREFQKAFNTDPELVFVAIPTETKEQAVESEQNLLDVHHANGQIFNVALDAIKNFQGLRHSEENKIKMVENRTIFAHREETKQRISQTMAGREATTGSLEAMRVANAERSTSVSIDGVIYPSLAAAGRAIRSDPATILKRINNVDPRFPNWRFAEPPKAEPRVTEKDLDRVE
jgi:group I intron endonuclease